MPQADDLISALDGEWRFELFPEGAEQPSFTGQRTYKRLMLDHPSLSWLEKFDGRDVVVAGVMGYDPEKSQFYELGIPNVGGSDYWIGELQEDGASIE